MTECDGGIMHGEGSVKFFNDQKGYGFICLDGFCGGKEVFVHQTKIKMEGHRTLHEGQKVVVHYFKEEKGYKAESVEPDLSEEYRPRGRGYGGGSGYGGERYGGYRGGYGGGGGGGGGYDERGGGYGRDRGGYQRGYEGGYGGQGGYGGGGGYEQRY